MKNRKKVLAALMAGVMTLSMGTTVFASAEDGYALKATNTEEKSPDNDLVIAIEGSVSSMDQEAIAFLYVQNQDLSGLSPEEIYDKYRDAYKKIHYHKIKHHSNTSATKDSSI